MNKIFSIAVVILITIYVSCTSVSNSNSKKEENKAELHPVYAMTFSEITAAIENKMVDSAGAKFSFDRRSSDTVLVDFWATWCKPCVNEIGKIIEGKLQVPTNMQFIGMSIDENREAWESYLSNKMPNWPQFIVQDESIVKQLNIEYIPHKILLNFADSTHKLNVELSSIEEQ